MSEHHRKSPAPETPLLVVRNLRKDFARGGLRSLLGRREIVHAVDGVSLEIKRGETLGLVGESGSGKSTLGRAILNLMPITSGDVLFEGRSVTDAPASGMRSLRRKMQIVFQDPYASLNPRMTVGDTLRDGLIAGGVTNARERNRHAAELLGLVGLRPTHIDAYPHKLSGGQRQRVAIARALSVGPAFIVADEPVSALDLSIQAQILNLLADIQAQLGLTYLFISHDLNVIRYLADRVAVMYRGRIVEQAPARILFETPRHPYTHLLFSAMPKIDRLAERQHGSMEARPNNAGSNGCSFHPRCPLAETRCLESQPALEPVSSEHEVACFRAASGPATA
jgi:oligopeptide/dipeptide ABC transporter ATP-binding protein